MTPERIEEIKGYVKTLLNPEQYSMDAFHNAADIMDERKIEWIVELLAALEEAQQTISRQKEALQSIYEESEDRVARHCADGAIGIEWEGEQS